MAPPDSTALPPCLIPPAPRPPPPSAITTRLYVNLITAITMGMMLAAEPAEQDIMQRPPRRPGKRLLGKLILWCAARHARLLSGASRGRARLPAVMCPARVIPGGE